jgi:hypothetical protein
MNAEFTSTPLFVAWPFWVLEINPDADSRVVEKAYQKINNSLQLKIPNTHLFPTPLGVRERDEFVLREARALLADPQKRLLAEFWYMPPAPMSTQSPAAQPSSTLAPIELAPINSAADGIDWLRVLRVF